MEDMKLSVLMEQDEMWVGGACILSHIMEGGHFSAGSIGFDPMMTENTQIQAGAAY